jgi:mRNA interferase RelE/StbE
MKIRFKASFLKAISKINDPRLKDEIALIIISIENAENISRVSKIKKLKNTKSDYRIRSGDYRIGLRLEGETIIFAAFAHRKDFYKYFPR